MRSVIQAQGDHAGDDGAGAEGALQAEALPSGPGRRSARRTAPRSRAAPPPWRPAPGHGPERDAVGAERGGGAEQRDRPAPARRRATTRRARPRRCHMTISEEGSRPARTAARRTAARCPTARAPSAVDHGVDRDDDGVGEREGDGAPARAVAMRLARQAERQHAAADAAATPSHAGGGRCSPSSWPLAQRDQQRRGAAHERVGEAQVAVPVGAGQGDVVADVDEQRRRDVGPARRPAAGRRQRAAAAPTPQPSTWMSAVSSALSSLDLISAFQLRVQQRPEQHRGDDGQLKRRLAGSAAAARARGSGRAAGSPGRPAWRGRPNGAAARRRARRAGR